MTTPTKVIICPPPPAAQSPLSTGAVGNGQLHGPAGEGPDKQRQTASTSWTDVSGVTGLPAVTSAIGNAFESPAWQGWFTQLYNQVKSQFVTTTAVADTAAIGVTTALANAAAALSAANSAIAALPLKLNNSAADVLSGAVNVTTSGGFVAGTLTWDSSGLRTGGSGVAMTSNGIVCYNGSTPTFAIDHLGNANFAGALGAASGTFAGTLSSVNGTFTGSLVGTTITGFTVNGGTINGGTFQSASSGFRAVLNSSGLVVYDSSSNVLFQCDNLGVYCSKPAGSVTAAITGTSASASAPGIAASSSGSSPALQCAGGSGGYAVSITSGSSGIVQTGGSTNYLLSTVAATTGQSCGSASFPWNDVYGVNAFHVTSDMRDKVILGPCERGWELIKQLDTYKFKWKIGKTIVKPHDGLNTSLEALEVETTPGVRYHYGISAQQLQELLGDDQCGMHSLADPANPESAQSYRQGELMIVLLKAVQELGARVEQLEAAALAAAGGA